MIRLSVIALFAVGSAAVAADVRPAAVPAGKMPTMQATARGDDCRAALFVPAGKINTYGHAATQPRCDTALIAAKEARRARVALAGRD